MPVLLIKVDAAHLEAALTQAALIKGVVTGVVRDAVTVLITEFSSGSLPHIQASLLILNSFFFSSSLLLFFSSFFFFPLSSLFFLCCCFFMLVSFSLPTAHYSLSTARYPIPTSHCSVSTPDHLFPTTRCTVPTLDYPFPTTRCTVPTLGKPFPTTRSTVLTLDYRSLPPTAHWQCFLAHRLPLEWASGLSC